jgi:hypothetical protein
MDRSSSSRRELKAGRGALRQQRRHGGLRRRLVRPLLLLLLLAAVADRSPHAAASIFGGDTASV